MALSPPYRSRNFRSDILFAFAIAIAIYTAWDLRHTLMLIYISALFAVVLNPIVIGISRLRIRRWSPGRGLSVLLLLLMVGAAITLFFLFAMPPVIHDLQEFTHELPRRIPQMLDKLRRLPFAQHLDVAALNARLQDWASNSATYVLLSIGNWAGGIFSIVTAIVLTVYFILEGDGAYRWALRFFPLRQRARLDATLMRAEVRMGKWLLGQGALMAAQGLSSTIVFLALDIRYAYALGVLMGVLNIIPVAGGMVCMTMVVFVAAIDSWGRVLGALVYYAVYSQFESSFLTPRIMRSSVGLPGLGVIVALLIGSALEGIPGAMVSVPTAVLVTVLLEEYLVERPSRLQPS